MARSKSDAEGHNIARITSDIHLDDPVVPSYSGKSGRIDEDPGHARSKARDDDEEHERDVSNEDETNSARKAVKLKKKKRKHQHSRSNDPELPADVKVEESNNSLTGIGSIPLYRNGRSSTIVQLDPLDVYDDNIAGERRERSRRSEGPPRTPQDQIQRAPFMDPPSSRKRKRDETSQLSPRRSNRAAAKTATAHITEQITNRPKAQASVMTTSPSTPKRKTRVSAMATTRGKQEYEVEKIVDSRLNKKTGDVEYLVQWVGYRKSDNTWEPADNLTHCTQKLKQYRASQKTK